MESSENRPKCGDPPQLDQPVEILKELLEIEQARLKVAVRIEEERRIVFPETSVIIRDIRKLIAAIENGGGVCKTGEEQRCEHGTVAKGEIWQP